MKKDKSILVTEACKWMARFAVTGSIITTPRRKDLSAFPMALK